MAPPTDKKTIKHKEIFQNLGANVSKIIHITPLIIREFYHNGASSENLSYAREGHFPIIGGVKKINSISVVVY